MNKAEILYQLRSQLWTRLQPSPIGGIGVFAIKHIPAGTEVFVACKVDDYVEIPESEIEQFSPSLSVLQYVRDFFVRENGVYYIPSYGPAAIDQSYFLNHSDMPNLKVERHGEIFIATRDIKAEEELTADYDTYGDGGL